MTPDPEVADWHGDTVCVMRGNAWGVTHSKLTAVASPEVVAAWLIIYMVLVNRLSPGFDYDSHPGANEY